MAKVKTPRVKKNQFENTLKLLLSSLSCRQNKYVYINCTNLENTIIISNGTYDLLTSYSPTQLSISVVTMTESYYKELIEFLHLPDENGKYMFRAEVILKAIRTFKKHELNIIHDRDGSAHLYQDGTIIESLESPPEEPEEEYDEEGNLIIMEDDEEPLDPFESINVFGIADMCGELVSDENACSILEVHAADIINLSDTSYLENNNWLYKKCEFVLDPSIQKAYSNIYKFSIDNFTDGELTLNLVDGLDIPSIKEFCKKLKLDKIDVFVIREHDTICSISKVVNDEFTVAVSRPCHGTILIKSKELKNV